MTEILAMLALKSKAILTSFLAGYVASTMRYFKLKRNGKEPKFLDWFAFGITAWLVTFSAYQFLLWLFPNMPEGVRLTIVFWAGYSSDYFYEWIPKLMKERFQEKFFNKNNEK